MPVYYTVNLVGVTVKNMKEYELKDNFTPEKRAPHKRSFGQ